PVTQADAALVAHVGSGRDGPIAPPWDARVPVLAELWTPNTASRRAAGAPEATRDVASIATAGGTAGPNPAPARSNAPAPALLQPVPDPAAEQAAAVDRGGLETALDAFDGPL